MPVIQKDFRHPCLLDAPCCQARTFTGSSSGMRCEVCMDLTASSAVNLPITSASLRLDVIWTGVRSIRWTYEGRRLALRLTFTTNLVVFIVFWCFHCAPRIAEQNVNSLPPGKCFSGHLEAHRSSTQAVRYWKELKEVLAMHGHRKSPVHNPQFPSFHEADTQSLF